MESQHTTEQVKDLRKLIDSVIQRLEAEFGHSRELAITKTKLEEAKMWAGKELGNLGNELPAEFADKADGPAQPTTEIAAAQHIVSDPEPVAPPQEPQQTTPAGDVVNIPVTTPDEPVADVVVEPLANPTV